MSLESHLRSRNADIIQTIIQSRKYVGQLSYIKSSLVHTERIVIALQEDVPQAMKGNASDVGNLGVDATSRFTSGAPTLQWARNLIRQLHLVESRITALIQGQQSTEQMV
jgi:hypothetical protein